MATGLPCKNATLTDNLAQSPDQWTLLHSLVIEAVSLRLQGTLSGSAGICPITHNRCISYQFGVFWLTKDHAGATPD